MPCLSSGCYDIAPTCAIGKQDHLFIFMRFLRHVLCKSQMLVRFLGKAQLGTRSSYKCGGHKHNIFIVHLSPKTRRVWLIIWPWKCWSRPVYSCQHIQYPKQLCELLMTIYKPAYNNFFFFPSQQIAIFNRFSLPAVHCARKQQENNLWLDRRVEMAAK